jgi:hypothetical protein
MNGTKPSFRVKVRLRYGDGVAGDVAFLLWGDTEIRYRTHRGSGDFMQTNIGFGGVRGWRSVLPKGLIGCFTGGRRPSGASECWASQSSSRESHHAKALASLFSLPKVVLDLLI